MTKEPDEHLVNLLVIMLCGITLQEAKKTGDPKIIEVAKKKVREELNNNDMYNEIMQKYEKEN